MAERRSLALRRPSGLSALRPYSPGYATFNGTTAQRIYLSRTAVPLVTSLQFSIKIRPAAVGVVQRLCGWDGVVGGDVGAELTIDAANKLTIRLNYTTAQWIGGGLSTLAIPGLSTSSDIWLRGLLVVADAKCTYWYSNDPTSDVDKVTWTQIGTTVTGVNAGMPPVLAESTLVNIGNSTSTTAAMSGRVYAFAEHVSASRTLWFYDTDIPSTGATQFTSASNGQTYYSASSGAHPVFTPSQTYSGGLRSDFIFGAVTTGLDTGELFGVSDIDYNTVRISYNPALIPMHPSLGAFQEAVIVRSTAGIPATSMDGDTIARYTNGDPVLGGGYGSVVDEGLLGKKWYYYGLFVRYDLVNAWFKVGETSWLNPAVYGYQQRTWENFPEYYRRIDSGVWHDPGLMRRLCNAIGYEYDLQRTWASTVGDVWDIDNIAATQLQTVGNALGLTLTPAAVANGDRRLRALVGNLMALRKSKGTKDSTESYIAAQTGYPVRAYEGINLIHSTQHSEWPYPFTAQDGSATLSTGNHPGWSSATTTVTGQLSRQTASGGEGTTFGAANTHSMPDGAFYLRCTNTTGATSACTITYTHTPATLTSALTPGLIAVEGGRKYRFSGTFKASQATNLNCVVDWFTETGTSAGAAGTHNAFLAAGTAWLRKTTNEFTAPAGARFARVRISSATLLPITTGHLNLFKPMFVDSAWRPEGVPALSGALVNAPLVSASAADLNSYVHQDYYEAPRQVNINVYPNRTNMAINSDFILPTPVWVSSDAPSYGQIPVVYTNYTDIIDAEVGDSETSYADLAAGLAPLVTGAPTITRDAATQSMLVTKTGTPSACSLYHPYFEVTDLGGMSAAIGAYSTTPGVKMTMMFQWYKAAQFNQIITHNGLPTGVPIRTVSPEYTLTAAENRFECINATPPDGALYAQLVLTLRHTAPLSVNVTWALIEDAAYPGPYFNGSFVDGDLGDFFYASGRGFDGALNPHLSPSVYYQQFKRLAAGAGGSDAVSQIVPLLLAFRRPFKVTTAATGLYNVIT